MKIDLIRDKTGVPTEGEVLPVNSLPGRQLAVIAQLHQEIGALSKDGTNLEAYADLIELLMELMRVNEVDWGDAVDRRVEKLERLGGFRKGLIWTRDVPVPSVDIPGYPRSDLAMALRRAMKHPDN